MIPPPLDPRVLAAEIEASVAEFNRLCALAASVQIEVVAEVQVQLMPGTPARPLLAVQVIARARRADVPASERLRSVLALDAEVMKGWS